MEQYNILKELANGYVTGNFDNVFQYLDDNCVWETQWSIEPRTGKTAVIEYYTKKGQLIKGSGSKCEYEIVNLITFDKLGVVVTQKQENKTIKIMLDVRFNDKNQILRIDVCEPTFFEYTRYNVNENLETEFDLDKMYKFREKTIVEHGEINLTKDNLNILKDANIFFIESSREGIVYLMDDKKNLYYTNIYEEEKVLYEDLRNVIKDFEGKNYSAINLGMGHALQIKNQIKDKFMKHLKNSIQFEDEFQDGYNAYCNWISCAITFLNHE